MLHLDEAGARGLAARLEDADFAVTRVEEKPYRRRPYPPFMTSTLQQEAGRKLRWSSQVTMRVAQRLYENGYITYMRTDSTNLSETALTAARSQARDLYGDAYVPAEPRHYSRKVKNAQEAHEAIRPAGDTFRTPGQLASALSSDEFRLYELIWQRTLASQMSDAVGTTVSVRLAGTSVAGERAEFATSGRTITFPGFLRAYVEDMDEDSSGSSGSAESGRDDSEKRLPQLGRGDALGVRSLEPTGHSTNPPARYTEASLVKALEELGIGRPSTYASIMQTIQDRGYVWKKGSALVPSWVAFAVVGLLEGHFGRLVDYGFTASVENDLDSIAGGNTSRVDWLRRFYFGVADGERPDQRAPPTGRISAQGGLKKLIAERLEDIDARGVNSIQLFGPDSDTVVRVGRYGPYVQQGGPDSERRASVPEDLPPDELTPEKVEELLSAPSGDYTIGTRPGDRPGDHRTQRPVRAVRHRRRADRVAVQDDVAGHPEPARTPPGCSRCPGWSASTRPPRTEVQGAPRSPRRTAGTGPTSSAAPTPGRWSRRSSCSPSPWTQALAIFAQPKTRGRRAAAAPPLKELGPDPVSQKPMVVKDGRFGPYVTDGETNASLRRGDSIEALTDERAAELLADRRARGPVKKATKRPAAKKAPAKKAAAKKTVAKKAAGQEGRREEGLISRGCRA